MTPTPDAAAPAKPPKYRVNMNGSIERDDGYVTAHPFDAACELNALDEECNCADRIIVDLSSRIAALEGALRHAHKYISACSHRMEDGELGSAGIDNMLTAIDTALASPARAEGGP